MIIFDTDILSMFAKVDEIGTLSRLFDEEIAVTPKIRDEISAPLEYGYSFPLKVLSRVKTVPLSKEKKHWRNTKDFNTALPWVRESSNPSLIARRRGPRLPPMT